MEILEDIVSGDWDDKLDDLINAIQTRRNILESQKRYLLSVGDRVRFNSHVKPRYLEGELATITGRKTTRLVIDMDRPVGRFKGKGITCPVSIIDKVEGGENA